MLHTKKLSVLCSSVYLVYFLSILFGNNDCPFFLSTSLTLGLLYLLRTELVEAHGKWYQLRHIAADLSVH